MGGALGLAFDPEGMRLPAVLPVSLAKLAISVSALCGTRLAEVSNLATAASFVPVAKAAAPWLDLAAAVTLSHP